MGLNAIIWYTLWLGLKKESSVWHFLVFAWEWGNGWPAWDNSKRILLFFFWPCFLVLTHIAKLSFFPLSCHSLLLSAIHCNTEHLLVQLPTSAWFLQTTQTTLPSIHRPYLTTPQLPPTPTSCLRPPAEPTWHPAYWVEVSFCIL